MAIETGATTEFSLITASGIELQSNNENAGLDEAQSIKANGGINDFYVYNKRNEPQAEYEVGINDSASAAQVSVDIGGMDGSIMIVGCSVTQGNQQYPKMSLTGFKPETGTPVGTSKYTFVVPGLYFGAHTTMGALSAETNLQNVTIAASALNRIEYRDGDGEHAESKIEAVRIDVNGSLIAATAPTITSPWQGQVWAASENQGYKVFNFRAFKLESCSGV